MTERKCVMCNNTTNKSLSDFYEIGWEAMSWNKRPAVCLCPDCCKKDNHTEMLVKASRDYNEALEKVKKYPSQFDIITVEVN